MTWLTWKKSAMVATWLAQAHFLASGTSSPTWRKKKKKKEKWSDSQVQFPHLKLFVEAAVMFAYWLLKQLYYKQAGCDSVITAHSNRHKANAAHSNYRERETQENDLIASRFVAIYLSITKFKHFICVSVRWRKRKRTLLGCFCTIFKRK